MKQKGLGIKSRVPKALIVDDDDALGDAWEHELRLPGRVAVHLDVARETAAATGTGRNHDPRHVGANCHPSRQSALTARRELERLYPGGSETRSSLGQHGAALVVEAKLNDSCTRPRRKPSWRRRKVNVDTRRLAVEDSIAPNPGGSGCGLNAMAA